MMTSLILGLTAASRYLYTGMWNLELGKSELVNNIIKSKEPSEDIFFQTRVADPHLVEFGVDMGDDHDDVKFEKTQYDVYRASEAWEDETQDTSSTSLEDEYEKQGGNGMPQENEENRMSREGKRPVDHGKAQKDVNRAGDEQFTEKHSKESKYDRQKWKKMEKTVPKYSAPSSCQVVQLSRRRLPLVALASAPGSGTTWVRHLLQQATGSCTFLYSTQYYLRLTQLQVY